MSGQHSGTNTQVGASFDLIEVSCKVDILKAGNMFSMNYCSCYSSPKKQTTYISCVEYVKEHDFFTWQITICLIKFNPCSVSGKPHSSPSR